MIVELRIVTSRLVLFDFWPNHQNTFDFWPDHQTPTVLVVPRRPVKVGRMDIVVFDTIRGFRLRLAFLTVVASL